jgi:hypothetical protein
MNYISYLRRRCCFVARIRIIRIIRSSNDSNDSNASNDLEALEDVVVMILGVLVKIYFDLLTPACTVKTLSTIDISRVYG